MDTAEGCREENVPVSKEMRILSRENQTKSSNANFSDNREMVDRGDEDFDELIRGFQGEDNDNICMPIEIDTTVLSHFVSVGRNKRSVSYAGNGRDPHDVGTVRANVPCPRDRSIYYFEVCIENAGAKASISIGLTARTKTVNCYPGWENDSFGYRANDGAKMNGDVRGDSYGPAYSTSDVVGCGIDFVSQEIFFTKNGQNLGVAFGDVKCTSRLYPSVGMHSPDERVTLNFDSNTFRFDIVAFTKKRREILFQDIRSVDVNPSVLSELVKSYLRFHGYEGTLNAVVAAENSALEKSADRVEVNGGKPHHDRHDRKSMRTAKEEKSGHKTSVVVDANVSEESVAKRPGLLDPTYEINLYLWTVRNDKNFGALSLRAALRHAIVRGRCEDAIERIKRSSSIFCGELPENSDAMRRLRRQQIVELIREGRVAEAVQLGRNEIRELRTADGSLFSTRSSTATSSANATDRARSHMTQIEDICGLLAYKDPLASPLSHLLTTERRSGAIDAINEAVLERTSDLRHSVSPLECALRHLELVLGESRCYH
eukprot:g293.t1